MDYIELVTQGKKGRVIIKILIYYFLGDVTIIPPADDAFIIPIGSVFGDVEVQTSTSKTSCHTPSTSLEILELSFIQHLAM